MFYWYSFFRFVFWLDLFCCATFRISCFFWSFFYRIRMFFIRGVLGFFLRSVFLRFFFNMIFFLTFFDLNLFFRFLRICLFFG